MSLIHYDWFAKLKIGSVHYCVDVYLTAEEGEKVQFCFFDVI